MTADELINSHTADIVVYLQQLSPSKFNRSESCLLFILPSHILGLLTVFALYADTASAN